MKDTKEACVFLTKTL